MGVIQKIIRKLAKRGFTLVEALIATILVGSCIMPIVGTMQNAANMTQRMVDDSKLQMLARSRMNLETSRANNEQKNVDITTTYCYDYYKIAGDEKTINSVQTTASPSVFIKNSSNFGSSEAPGDFAEFVDEYLVKAYSVDVEVRDDVTLFSGDAAEKEEKGFNGLKQVVVTARVIAVSGDAYCGEDGKILDVRKEDSQSYSLVSLITVPAVSTEYIWALDKEGRKVLGLDPITGLTAVGYSLDTYLKATDDEKKEIVATETIEWSSILVKPDGKSLLLVGSVNENTANWEYYCGNFCVDPTNERCGSFVSANNFEILKSCSSYINTSCVVRPDGKKAYFTNGNNIYATTLDWDSKTNPCDSKETITSTSGKKYSNLKVGNDGYLYYLEKDSATDANICRVSMYSNGIGKSSEISNLIDYALSPDGLRVYALTCNNESNKTSQGYSLKVYDSKALNEIPSEKVEFENKYSKVNCSNIACSADSKYIIMYDKGYVEGVTVQKAKAYFYEIGSDKNVLNSSVSADNDKKIKYIEFPDSPINGSSKKLIYAPVTNALAADCNNNRLNLIYFAEFKNNVVASASTGKENNVVTTTEINAKTLTDISARNPEFLYVAVNEGTEAEPKYKVKTLDVTSGSYIEDLEYDFNEKPINLILTPVGDRLLVVTEPATGETGRRLYVVDLIRNEINEPEKAAYGDNYFFLNQKTPSNEPIICFYGSDGSQFYKLEYDNSLTLIGNNSSSVKILQLSDGKLLWYDTNGLTLYEKPTVTDTNLTLGSKIVTYNGENFPPSDITDMAISPDDRVLALKCGDKIKFYDFKTYDFGEDTKMDGYLFDVRTKNFDLKLTPVAQLATCSMLINTPSFSLKSKIIKNETFVKSDQEYNRRIFGYVSPKTSYGIKPINEKPIRAFINQKLGMYSEFFYKPNDSAIHGKYIAQVDLAGEGKVCVEKYAAFIDGLSKFDSGTMSYYSLDKENEEKLKKRGWQSLSSKMIGWPSNIPFYMHYPVTITKHSNTLESGIRPIDSIATTSYDATWEEIFTYHCWLSPYDYSDSYWSSGGNNFKENNRKYKYMEFKQNIEKASKVHVDLYYYPSTPNNDSSNKTLELKRDMSIEIEDQRVDSLFNAYKSSNENQTSNKLYRPFVKSYDTVIGNDGQLNIRFRNMTNDENAMVSAIKLTCWKPNGNNIDTNTSSSHCGGLFYSAKTSDTKIGDSDWNVEDDATPFFFEPAFMCEFNCSSLEDNKIEFKKDGSNALTNHAQNWSSSQKYIKETFYPLDSIANNASETLNKQIFLSESPYSDDYITYDFNDKNYKRKDGKKIASCTETILKSAGRTAQNVYINSSSSVAEVADLTEPVKNCNRAIVADGGIYYVADTGKIYKYNPNANIDVLGSTTKTDLTDICNLVNTASEPIAVYDNKIYGFSYGGENVYKYDIEKDAVSNSFNYSNSISEETKEWTLDKRMYLSPTSCREVKNYNSSKNGSMYLSEVHPLVNGSDCHYWPGCKVSWYSGDNYDGNFSADKMFDNDEDTYMKFGKYDSDYRTFQLEYDKYFLLNISNNIVITIITDRKLLDGSTKLFATDSDGDERDVPVIYKGESSGKHRHEFNLTFGIADSNKYKKFKIQMTTSASGNQSFKVYEVKVYGKLDSSNNKIKLTLPGNTITASGCGMTTVMNDNLDPVNVSNGAVCSTPYGIMLAGGGGTKGSKEALLYWPHAVADYDAVSQTQREGIFRSLPDMKNDDKDVYMKNCSMCWHKGKAYVFGDGTDEKNTSKCSLMIYDPETNSWSVGTYIDRKNAAVVSFGDYIYIIGGETLIGSKNCPRITRYTPDGSTADICDLPDNLAKNISAVAYGSSIYLIGGQKSDGNPSYKIYRFTP